MRDRTSGDRRMPSPTALNRDLHLRQVCIWLTTADRLRKYHYPAWSEAWAMSWEEANAATARASRPALQIPIQDTAVAADYKFIGHLQTFNELAMKTAIRFYTAEERLANRYMSNKLHGTSGPQQAKDKKKLFFFVARWCQCTERIRHAFPVLWKTVWQRQTRTMVWPYQGSPASALSQERALKLFNLLPSSDAAQDFIVLVESSIRNFVRYEYHSAYTRTRDQIENSFPRGSHYRGHADAVNHGTSGPTFINVFLSQYDPQASRTFMTQRRDTETRVREAMKAAVDKRIERMAAERQRKLEQYALITYCHGLQTDQIHSALMLHYGPVNWETFAVGP